MSYLKIYRKQSYLKVTEFQSQALSSLLLCFSTGKKSISIGLQLGRQQIVAFMLLKAFGQAVIGKQEPLKSIKLINAVFFKSTLDLSVVTMYFKSVFLCWIK